MRTCALFLAAIFCGCTVKVEPLPKKKPRIVHHYHYAHKGHKAHPHGTPPPHGMLAPDEPTKLIEHPTPQP